MRIIPDVISRQDLATFRTTDNAAEAAKSMVERGISSVLITDDVGTLLGIATERDFTRVFVVEQADLTTTTLADLMTPSPDTVEAADPARSALELMELRGYRHLPVVDEDGKAIGIVSIRDLYSTVSRAAEDVLVKTQGYVFGDRYNPEV